MSSNIVPMKADFAKLEGMSERITARATDLLRTLGEGGRMVLSKHEVRDLIYFMDTRKTFTAGEHRWFAEFEVKLRQRHGLAVKAVSVATDGVVRADRDPSHRNTPKALVSELEAKNAVKAKLMPKKVMNDRSWCIPKARPTGENVVDFMTWKPTTPMKSRKSHRRVGGDGPRAA